MSITKVDGLDSLFSRRVILNKSANAVADRMPMSSSNAKFCAVAGWHSYSLLKLKEAVKASDSVARRKRIANIYRAYACAADYAAVSTPGVKILEIQGEIIHFFLPFGQGDESKVIVFARKFNALVEDYVYSKYEDDIRQFHQAAQFGNSILISKDAPNGDGAAYSIVSLGPCANNPAKRIGKSKVGVSRPLWLPNDDGVTWRAEECATDQEVVQNKALYANDQRYRDFVDVMDSMIEPEDGEPSESGFEFKDVYFFRADMDGFTNKVKKAFDLNP